MLQNLRAVFRGLLESRRFTALVVVSLALGVGVNSAMFAVIDALLLRSLPVVRPQELMLYKRSWPGGEQTRFSYPALRYFRDQSQSLDGIGGATILNRVRSHAGADGRVQFLTVQMVTGGFFDVLGLEPLLGRLIAPSDDQVPGQHAVAVLSHAYWQRAFASDPGIAGQSVVLNETPYTILGVAPREFYGIEPGAAPDVWVPTMMQAAVMELPSLVDLPTFNWLYLIARPKPGAPRAQSTAEQALLLRQYNEQRAQKAKTEQARLEIRREQLEVLPAGGGITRLAEGYRQPMVALMAAVGIVLFISCLNLSTLALARMTQRMKEISIRFALGATTGQVLLSLTLESLVLATIGSVLGTALGQALMVFAVRLMPAGPTRIPLTLDLEFNVRTLAFSAGLALFVTLFFTIVPALRIARADLVKGLSDNVGRLVGGNAGRAGPVRNIILVTQVGASVVLLACGGLFVETLRNLRAQELGFDPARTAMFQVALPRTYPPAQVHQFSLRLLDRLTHMTGLEAATWGSPSLLSGYESRMLVAAGDVSVKSETQIESYGMSVAPNFFSAMKVGLVAGRAFSEQDTREAPAVGIISETAARVLFRDQPPIGQHLRVRTGQAPWGAPIEIVGVVKDTRFKDLRSDIAPLVYRPVAQGIHGLSDGLVIKSPASPAMLADMLRREIRAIDPNAALDELETMSQRVDRWAERERVLASVAAIFGLLALLLACLGMYGVTSLVVSERRREIAIRLAIGSSLRQVTWLFVRRAVFLALGGALIGVPAAFLIARAFTAYFFNVTLSMSSGLWAALILAIAVPTVASWLAVRAEGRVEPASALKAS